MSNVKVTAIIPCLNEEETLGICIEKAQQSFRELGIEGEVVVGDNGSTDRSVEIAESLGARVAHQSYACGDLFDAVFDQAGNGPSFLRGLFGQIAHFLGDDGEALACLAGTGCFNRCVERQ